MEVESAAPAVPVQPPPQSVNLQENTTTVGDSSDKTESSDREAGTVVWAKLAGFPVWPSRLAKLSEVPMAIRKIQRPDQVLVYFFGSHDFAWIGKRSVHDWEKNKEQNLRASKSKVFQIALEECEQWLQTPPSERTFIEVKEEEIMEEEEEQEEEKQDTRNVAVIPQLDPEERKRKGFSPRYCKYWPRETRKLRKQRLQRRLGLRAPLTREDVIALGYRFTDAEVTDDDHLPECTLMRLRATVRNDFRSKKNKKVKSPITAVPNSSSAGTPTVQSAN